MHNLLTAIINYCYRYCSYPANYEFLIVGDNIHHYARLMFAVLHNLSSRAWIAIIVDPQPREFRRIVKYWNKVDLLCSLIYYILGENINDLCSL